MLPNMQYVFVVIRSVAGQLEHYLPTACLSAMVDLETDSLLDDLENEAFLSVSKNRLVNESSTGDLARQLELVEYPFLEPDQMITLIPVKSVVPLLRAYESIPGLMAADTTIPKGTYKKMIDLARECEQDQARHNNRN